jgi:TPR repeat protein
MRGRSAVLAIVAAALGGFWAGERHAGERADAQLPAEVRSGADASAVIAPAPHAPAKLEAVAAVPPRSAPLPPIGTPVAQVLDDLKRDAQAGDARAACRLAFELERCEDLRALQASIATFRDHAERPGIGPELARRYNAIADRDQVRLADGRRLCEGVSTRQAADAWRYLLQAARAGHAPSMARFASRRVFSDADPVAALDGLIAFRNEGPTFLARAAQAGDAEAYEQLAFAYVTGMDLGLGVPHDAVRGVAYYTALARVATPDERTRLQRAIDYAIQNDNLAAGDVARARAMAEPLAAVLLRHHAPGTVEVGRAPFSADNGSHCER